MLTGDRSLCAEFENGRNIFPIKKPSRHCRRSGGRRPHHPERRHARHADPGQGLQRHVQVPQQDPRSPREPAEPALQVFLRHSRRNHHGCQARRKVSQTDFFWVLWGGGIILQ
jgi:hypothetical protein